MPLPEPTSISTCDPEFDPNKPVVVNGYRFVPDGRGDEATWTHPDETPMLSALLRVLADSDNDKTEDARCSIGMTYKEARALRAEVDAGMQRLGS